MSKLYFYYSAMNAGKSSTLLQTAFNYSERGMTTSLYIPKIIESEYIESRIGLKQKAIVFDADFNFFEYHKDTKVHSILIDEAQFLSRNQVFQLCKIVDLYDIPVLCFGLRTDFQANAFEGSQHLLCLADELVELKTICFCGKKATMNLRKNSSKDDGQIEINKEKYISLCRGCYIKTA